MAQPSSPLNAFLTTIGVTLGVVLVSGFVLSGPAIVECSRSDAGFGTCVRTKLTDAGLLSKTGQGDQPEAQPTAPTANTATPAAQSEETVPAEQAPNEGAEAPATPETAPTPTETAPAEAAPSEPAPAAAGTGTKTASAEPATSEPSAVPADKQAPELGLVRAEPDGSLVIAGSAAPDAKVDVYANDALIGTTTAQKSGDWVLVPEKPLAPGGYEISATDAAGDKTSKQTVVVAINQDKTSQPLVIASEEGKASQILQGLNAPADKAPADKAPADNAPAADKATPPAAAAPAASDAAPPPAQKTEQVAALDNAKSVPAEPATPKAPAPAIAQPSIDAIEIDGDKNFIAGTGQDGATMRVYIDNKLAGDTVVKNGHWLLETGNLLTKKAQRVRVDQLAAGSADVTARAEVEFLVEQTKTAQTEPKAGGQTQTAQADGSPIPTPDFSLSATPPEAPPSTPPVTGESPATLAAALPTPDFGIDTQKAPPTPVTASESETPAPASTAQAPAAPPAPDFSIDTQTPPPVETATAQPKTQTQSDQARQTTVPSATPAEPSAPAPEAKAPAQTAMAETSQALPTPDFGIDTQMPPPASSSTAAEPAPAVTAPATPKASEAAPPAAAAPAETALAVPPPPFALDQTPPRVPDTAQNGDVPVMIALPVGRPDQERFSSGKAIIRRGDNLWTIARRVYGYGIRYTAIYQANRGQIRNPNLIYPGQVFELPGTDETVGTDN